MGQGTRLETVIANTPDLANSTLTAYRCPSDLGPLLRNPAGGTFGTWGTSNYKACTGHRRDALTLTVTPGARSGVFWQDSKIGIRDILDGSSNTILIGEIAYERGTLSPRAGVWIGSLRACGGNSAKDVFANARGAINHSNNVFNELSESYSSVHDGGAQFLLGDGSVRFISENIHYVTNGPNNTSDVDSTYERLTARDDGQPIGDF